ncbi:protein of unknown function [Saccharopolyspora kobensis]|uniref:DUF4192 domain-containing protein n=1 Tax=Saccharopolyspora kobensis TaxID=146035 RepID=A0A1H6DQW7_9PSEU|nr:DUF4192 domain-containing protein [Saccharopolyspora kobensis]SEG87083.1 protein of unknown function [Saccharopolyspora kobensis]SFE08005.1 protein of unknown function [Saccharopolyspora kobensis]
MTTRLNTTVSLTEPADVLAAVPHMLGFHPTDSLVVLTLHDLAFTPRFGVTLRTDLPCSMQICGFGEHLLSGPLGSQRAEAVMLVVVGAEPNVAACDDNCAGACRRPLLNGPDVDENDTGPPHADLIDMLRDSFNRAGIVTAHAMWAPEIQAGARWRCYADPKCSGEIPDPKSSPVAAAMAAAGAVTFGSRDELRALVEPESPQAVARWSAKLDVLAEERIEDDAQNRVARDVQLVLAAVQRAASGSALTEDDRLRVLLAVSDTRVRDIALGTALGETARAAEELWLALVRNAPAPELPEVAALLAFSAYLRGEGALAGAALERIERTRPDHQLGILLRQAMESGLPPAELAIIARDAAEDARIVLEEEGTW